MELMDPMELKGAVKGGGEFLVRRRSFHPLWCPLFSRSIFVTVAPEVSLLRKKTVFELGILKEVYI